MNIRFKEKYLGEVITARLTELGCDALPSQIRRQIEAEFTTAAHRKVHLLAGRTITMPKIAKAFVTASQGADGGGSGGGAALPPDEVGYGDQSQNP